MNPDEVEEIKRHFNVVAEGLQGQVRQVAESVAALDEKMDRRISSLQESVDRRLDATDGLIKTSYSHLERRITSVEKRVEKLEEV